MRIVIYAVCAVALLFVGALAGAFLQSVARFDLAMNEISRPVLNETSNRQGQTVLELVPKPFAAGESAAQVRSSLAAGGYRLVADHEGQTYANLLKVVGEAWKREANLLRCEQDLIVVVAFDVEDRLERARGIALMDGCHE